MAGRLFALVYWIYSKLWRLEEVNRPKLVASEEKFTCAHWHGDELLLVARFTPRPMAVMASRSRDGEFMKKVLEFFGYSVSRGSSSRGGAGGLKGLIDSVNQKNSHASLAVDGPRGPIYKVKPGVLKLALETGTRILPGAADARHKFVFRRAWNQCYLPLPFSKCVIVYGDPIEVPKDSSAEMLEAIRLKLEAELLKLKDLAHARVSSKGVKVNLKVHLNN